MVAIPLPFPDVRKSQAAGSNVQTPFQPLDPGVLNAAIPTFFIGCNRHGFWVARDPKGEHGGIFLFKHSALAFARDHSRPSACAMIFPSESFELDLENEGNPFVGILARFCAGSRRFSGRLAA